MMEATIPEKPARNATAIATALTGGPAAIQFDLFEIRRNNVRVARGSLELTSEIVDKR